MPRYRFSWDAFTDDVVEELAWALGHEPDETDESARSFLERRVKRPTPSFVKDHKDAILECWVARHEATARYLYQRLVDAGLGPLDYRPRSHSGYMKFLSRTVNSKSFRAFLAEAMIAYGDQDRAPDDDSTPDFLPRFAIVDTDKAIDDPRQPHDYQRDAWERMGLHLAEAEAGGVFQGRLVMPTGAGKTFTAVRWLTENVLARGGRILWPRPPPGAVAARGGRVPSHRRTGDAPRAAAHPSGLGCSLRDDDHSPRGRRHRGVHRKPGAPARHPL